MLLFSLLSFIFITNSSGLVRTYVFNFCSIWKLIQEQQAISSDIKITKQTMWQVNVMSYNAIMTFDAQNCMATHSIWHTLELVVTAVAVIVFYFLVFFPTVAVFVIKELLLASISKWANGKAFSYFTESAHRSIHEVFISLIICYIWSICQVYKYVHIHVSVCVFA